MNQPSAKKRSRFPPLFWLAVLFEFFERGSYYGMMSVLSVYLTDQLHFSKPDVGVIKGTIQPLLYFLPILSGALADRFGFRRTLLVAFALLGGGYLLTSQATTYAAVFLSLVVLGLGAGTFKPIISGTIARCTDSTNSTLGFGVFYWSINLGAFLVPLILVPFLKKNFGWNWVILASAIGTSAMILPTLLFFREPPAPKQVADKPRPGLLQTLASAFEIVYSPFILLQSLAVRSTTGRAVVALLLLALLCGGVALFLQTPRVDLSLSAPVLSLGETKLEVRVQRNLSKPQPYTLKREATTGHLSLRLHDPDRLEGHLAQLQGELGRQLGAQRVSEPLLRRTCAAAEGRARLSLSLVPALSTAFQLQTQDSTLHQLRLRSSSDYQQKRTLILDQLHRSPLLAGLGAAELDDLVARASQRSFLVLFLGVLLGGGLLVLRLQRSFQAAGAAGRLALLLGTLAATTTLLFLLPGLSLFARILSSVIASTLLALYAIDAAEEERFRDHLRFLSMIFIYSGFWVLYFQMFDSVLWYVQAYVDTSSLDSAVNTLLSFLGLSPTFRFDVEHVTVIDAGTIILLQLLVSYLVKSTRALPTMIAGISFATLGMAVLSLSTGIWVLLLGITIFSIGEMTAHPKFISYVGQIAPPSRVALYMGYLFLYGVIGSSIGGVVGANLYVTFVDELNRPRTLWLIFAGIGLATVIGLLIYNRLVARPRPTAT